MEDQMRQGTYWLGAFFGALVMLLCTLIIDRLTEEPYPVQLPKDVIAAYNMGIKDALKTNPPSLELEQVCVSMWADKQPVR